MEYSLYSLNQQADLNILTLQDLINKLNLIGFEVDDIFQEPLKTNPNLQNTRLLIKIPANREDLLQEPLLIKEFEVIFLIKILNLWNKVNKKYSFFLKHKYFQYSDYKSITIQSNISNICVYQIALENIITQPSPIWIQQKLLNAGLAISEDHWTNLLNLIGIESGHSLQLSSFTEKDYFSKVKQIKNEFSIVLKEGKVLTLPKGTIVLENKDEKIQNILGYLDFFVNEDTSINDSNRLIVTSMFYDIHENALGLNTLNSKLSLRYLRKSFFEKLIFALERFLTLVELTTSAKILLNKYETKENLIELKPIKILKLTKKLLEQFLNTKDYQLDIFKKTGLHIICETPQSFYFEIPNHRNDLLREIDLVEEYTRCCGYANFKEILPRKELIYSKKKLLNYNFIKQFFLNHGFNEIFTNSIQDQKKEGNQSVTISNPLNNELSILRENLFSKLIEVFELNKKLGFKNPSFFEIGRVFKISEQKIIEQDKLSGIFESVILNNPILQTNEQFNTFWFINKGIIEKFLANFGYLNISFEKNEELNSFFHPTRSAIIKSNTKILGKFGELHPEIAKTLRISKTKLFVFEVNLHHFKNWRMNSNIATYQEYSKYPSISKDLSFTIQKTKNFDEIKTKIKNNIKYLKEVSFFDIYMESSIKDKVNVGIRLEFQSVLQTLTTQEIEIELEKVRQQLLQDFEVEFKN